MKNLCLLAFSMFLSLGIFAQNDFKTDARAELKDIQETLVKADPSFEMDMKEQNNLLRLLMAEKRHISALENGLIKEEKTTKTENLVEQYRNRMAVILGAERMEVLEAAKAEAEAEEPAAEEK